MCDRIAATGALEEAREQALTLRGEAKPASPTSTVRRSARERSTWWRTGVVERYA